jgi:hypothetical protein
LTKPCVGADLTVTQELIKNEIIRLGGDWEPRLVGFIGPRFTARHYEMLEHLTCVESVHLINVNVPPSAFSSIAKASAVRRLDIQNGSCSAEGIEALGRLPHLSRVILEGVAITKKGMESLSQLETLEHLVLDDVDVPPNSLGTLAKMRGLHSLYIATDAHIDKHEIEKLKASLPRCEIDVTGK